MLTEFLEYLELQDCNHPHDIQEHHLKGYLNHLYERPNHKWGGGLSKNFIRKQMQVIKKFSRYLTESGQESFNIQLRIRGKSSNIKSILTTEEVIRLYEVTKDDTFGMRDRVILALYYGCGLRKSEGVSINVQDILLEKDLVYVRKGKGHKERYVPLSGSVKSDLENYIHYSRTYLSKGKKEEALLLTVHGKRLSGAMVYERLQKLRDEARLTQMIGLHILRHSIASHLLHSGMKLEQIQHFLGHSSLESTQIYTHLKDGKV